MFWCHLRYPLLYSFLVQYKGTEEEHEGQETLRFMLSQMAQGHSRAVDVS